MCVLRKLSSSREREREDTRERTTPHHTTPSRDCSAQQKTHSRSWTREERDKHVSGRVRQRERENDMEIHAMQRRTVRRMEGDTVGVKNVKSKRGKKRVVRDEQE